MFLFRFCFLKLKYIVFNIKLLKTLTSHMEVGAKNILLKYVKMGCLKCQPNCGKWNIWVYSLFKETGRHYLLILCNFTIWLFVVFDFPPLSAEEMYSCKCFVSPAPLYTHLWFPQGSERKEGILPTHGSNQQFMLCRQLI